MIAEILTLLSEFCSLYRLQGFANFPKSWYPYLWSGAPATYREAQRTSPSLFSLCLSPSEEKSFGSNQTPASALLLPSDLSFLSGSRTSQNQVGFRWWDLSLRHCSVPSTLSAAPHFPQLFSLYVSPPRNTLATILINIPMPSENNSSSQSRHLLCHGLGSVWTKEGASI